MTSSIAKPNEKSHLRIVPTLLRILAAGVVAGAVLAVFRVGSSAAEPVSPLPARVAVSVLSGVLYVGVLAPLALMQTGGRLKRMATLFVTLYVTGAVTDLVEAYFYTTLLTPVTLVAALVVEAIPDLVIVAIVAALLPHPWHGTQAMAPLWRRRPLSSWVWRLLVAGLFYVPIYYAFAALVTPIEHQFYFDPAFIAQLHTVVPPDSITIPLEAIRGVFFGLGLLPALAVMPGRRWSTFLYLALIGVVIEAWVPLLGLTTWPLAMRLGNAAELTGDALGRAAVAIGLLGLPPLVGARWRGMPTRMPA